MLQYRHHGPGQLSALRREAHGRDLPLDTHLHTDKVECHLTMYSKEGPTEIQTCQVVEKWAPQVSKLTFRVLRRYLNWGPDIPNTALTIDHFISASS